MPSLAFFGATGDSAGFCLVHALNAGYDCTALARTPSKLTASLEAKGVPTKTLERHLTIADGNVMDIEAVKRTLQPPSGETPTFIINGIGGAPKMQWSLFTPATLEDPRLCQNAGATILRALQELAPAKKPVLITISTTGITRRGVPRDLPLAYVPLYRWLGHVMHEDKRAYETRLAEHMRLPESERGLEGYVNVKPTLLMDGEALGLQAVKEGMEEKPAIGYTIRRADVGHWIFERIIKGGEARKEWLNRSVAITY